MPHANQGSDQQVGGASRGPTQGCRSWRGRPQMNGSYVRRQQAASASLPDGTMVDPDTGTLVNAEQWRNQRMRDR